MKYLCVVLEQALVDFDREQKTGLKEAGTLVAVSGGMDSMVLADLFLKSGFTMQLAHVNFGLRGEESDLDEKLVREFAKKNQLILHCFHPDTKRYAEEKGWSVQMAARELRYDFFTRCLKENNLQYVATAHHANDNLENFFIYLLRENMRASLSGIAPKTGQTIRPLLSVNREDIEAYAIQNHIAWREDSSNSKLDYLRNKIRHSIVPGLVHDYPEVLKDYSSISQGMREYFQTEENSFIALIARYLVRENEAMEFIPGEIKREINGIAALRWYFRSKGFHQDVIKAILESGQTGNKFHAGGITVYVEAFGYRTLKEDSAMAGYEFQIRRNDLPCKTMAGKYLLEFDITAADKELRQDNTWYFDAEAVAFPITVRNWHSGDRICPWGTNFSKKVSDILTDAKVGSGAKTLYPVLDSANGLLGITGLRRSNLAPVQESSSALVRIKWQLINTEFK